MDSLRWSARNAVAASLGMAFRRLVFDHPSVDAAAHLDASQRNTDLIGHGKHPTEALAVPKPRAPAW